MAETTSQIGVGLMSRFGCGEDSLLAELANNTKIGEENIFTVLFSGSAGGLAHLDSNGAWEVFNTEKSEIPGNIITGIASDGKGGLWIGTYCNGLAHLTHDGKWKTYNTDNSPLPANFINVLLGDEYGVWVGIAVNGIIHINNSSGEWRTFNKADGLPYNNVISEPVSDGMGGIWFGMGNNVDKKGSLVHLNSNGDIETFNTSNSGLPNNVVSAIAHDGENGLWVGTQGDSLTHLTLNNKGIPISTPNDIALSNVESSKLPDNFINAIVSDGNDGVWLGAGAFLFEGGLYHINSKGEWTIFDTDNSDLPNSNVFSLLKDNNNQLWIGTQGGGLARLDCDGKWEVFNTKNSKLPDNYINALENDGHGGIWIGTRTKGLVHYNSVGEWTIYNASTYPDLLSDTIIALLSDGNGGVWVGGFEGLIHLSNKRELTTYSPHNSELPFNTITALMSDGNDGLWMGAGVGENVRLVQLTNNKQWNIFELPNNNELETDNEFIPFSSDNNKWNISNAIIQVLVSDNSGGIWIGTHQRGLFHRNFRGDWNTFNTTNSGLPNDRVRAIANDGSNGLWLATWGLAHLTFSQKPLLCEKVPNMSDESCEKLLESKRSAILVHPNGIGSGYNSDIAIDNMATYVYQTLFMRGYDHDEIYYIAHKPNLDFNQDGISDFEIVDAPVKLDQFVADDKKQLEPITIEHITTAFDWAKNQSHKAKAKGISEEPLVITFVGHGKTDELILGPLNSISNQNTFDEGTFNNLLEDYQTETGNGVVVILEACQTGTLIDGLQAENRLIVTSTDKNLAYYKDSGRTSFSNFYFDTINHGNSYWKSKEHVKDRIFTELGAPFSQQEPKLEDFVADNQTAKNLCLNGCYGQLPEPVLTPESLQRSIVNDGIVKLTVNIVDNIEEENDGQNPGIMCRSQDRILDVSVSVITPQDADKYDNEAGFEITKPLLIENLNKGENGNWSTTWNNFTQPGQYSFIFRADYKVRGGIRTVSAKPVMVTVSE
jgi:ligand-binding sensor domain-containing protein